MKIWISCLALITLSLLSQLGTAAESAASKKDAATRHGSLVICGGGAFPKNVRDRFVELAGGKDAILIVIPTASADVTAKSKEALIKFWKDAGIGKVRILHTRDRTEADSARFNQPIQQATAVWFGGGLQSRLAASYQGTKTEKAIRDLFERGGVIGGTSAGAAIQTRVMIQSGNPKPVITRGLDLLPQAIIDQHFLKRNRANRLLAAVRQHPDRLGIGICESTAIHYQNRKCSVIGSSFVTAVSVDSSTQQVSINVYHSGQSFALPQAKAISNGADKQSDPASQSSKRRIAPQKSSGSMPRSSNVVAVEKPDNLPFQQGSETLVVIPDTEGYCRKRPEVLEQMLNWVVAEKASRNIRGLLHVGDVTNDNLPEEWANARKAFRIIDGHIPYVLAAGNHDYDNTEGRLTLMNRYFKADNQKRWPGFGDVMIAGQLENHYQFLTIQGRKWIVLSLEMGPRTKVISWANEVLKNHPDHLAIILTHGYLFYENERYDHRKGKQRATPYQFYGEGADGEMLWKQLVSGHPNVMLVICGHLSSQYVGYRQDKTEFGNVVHQMLVDYEKLKGGGQGFLRLLEFLPDKHSIQVRTYSPLTRKLQSPVTLGDKPLRDPALECFKIRLQFAKE